MLLRVDAYFDEGGTHAPSHLVTLAGGVTTRKRWRALERGWRRILGDEGISEFKASDCDIARHEFKGWSEPRRVRFRQRLAAEIDRWVEYAVAVSAVADDYRKEICHRVGRGTHSKTRTSSACRRAWSSSSRTGGVPEGTPCSSELRCWSSDVGPGTGVLSAHQDAPARVVARLCHASSHGRLASSGSTRSLAILKTARDSGRVHGSK
jgi:hypothetical protein